MDLLLSFMYFVFQLKDLREKLKDMSADLDAKAREILEKIKEKSKDYWKKILEKLGFEKRAIEFHLEEAFAEDE